MVLFGFGKKTAMPSPEEALPGRTVSMSVPDDHYVNGKSLKPPFPEGMELALFGMGCFWGAERKFWQLDGVYSTAVGYAAGYTPNPTYQEVCSAMTGHNEVVRVVHGNVEKFLRAATTPYDIIFMDPPFSGNLADSTCRILSRGELITGSTMLYIESLATKEQLPLPPTWDIIRQKDHGTVRSTLINLKPIVHDI